MRRLPLRTDLEDLLTVFLYFCCAHTGDLLKFVRGGGVDLGDSSEGAIVKDYERGHALLFSDEGAPLLEVLF